MVVPGGRRLRREHPHHKSHGRMGSLHTPYSTHLSLKGASGMPSTSPTRGASAKDSVQFSRSVVSSSLQPHRLQQARLPCPSPTPGACSNSFPSNHLILCCPLLLLPSIFPSICVFSNESVFHIRWPRYRSFSFSISPSKEYSGLISFRIDWFDLLAV